MTLYDKRKKQILEDLKDREYRDAFVEESINVGIPFQLKSLREQRGFTQKDFEEISGKKQAFISRLENPNEDCPTLKTLKEMAAVYDVGLVVRFVPISELVEWELNLDSESLKALSYEDDPYFKSVEKETVVWSAKDIIDFFNLKTLDKVTYLKPVKRKKPASFASENTGLLKAACG